MKTKQNLTEFNTRVQALQAVTGKSQTEIAELLAVSRTTLHYYCTGQHVPKASALYRLAQAEQPQNGALAAGDPRSASERHRYPETDPQNGTLAVGEQAGGLLRTEGELTRHLRWLQDARRRQEEATVAVQRHLREIESWIRETEAELRRVREGRERQVEGGKRDGGSKEKRTILRDIDTVSLPIFGALPAGWPQTREGVMRRRPLKTVLVRRGQFPDGAFGLEVRGDSMNAARPMPVLDGDVVVLLSPEQREPQPEDIVAALIDGETCLKRLKTRKRPAGAFLKSESTNPAHGEIYPAHELVIQGVLVGKL